MFSFIINPQKNNNILKDQNKLQPCAMEISFQEYFTYRFHMSFFLRNFSSSLPTAGAFKCGFSRIFYTITFVEYFNMIHLLFICHKIFTIFPVYALCWTVPWLNFIIFAAFVGDQFWFKLYELHCYDFKSIKTTHIYGVFILYSKIVSKLSQLTVNFNI